MIDKDKCVQLVERLAQMPDTDETMRDTWCQPDWDDLCDWWRDFVAAAREITGKSYEEPHKPGCPAPDGFPCRCDEIEDDDNEE